jgi:hypothetical protein
LCCSYVYYSGIFRTVPGSLDKNRGKQVPSFNKQKVASSSAFVV